jgi:hypothetical protein
VSEPTQVKLLPTMHMILGGRTPEENYRYWLRKWARGEGVAHSGPNGPAYAWEEVGQVQQAMIDAGEWKPSEAPPF